MSLQNVTLPHLGEGIDSAEIAVWHKHIGDAVVKDEDLCEVVTDKVSFNVAAPCDGVLKELKFNELSVASIGDVIAIIEE